MLAPCSALGSSILVPSAIACVGTSAGDVSFASQCCSTFAPECPDCAATSLAGCPVEEGGRPRRRRRIGHCCQPCLRLPSARRHLRVFCRCQRQTEWLCPPLSPASAALPPPPVSAGALARAKPVLILMPVYDCAFDCPCHVSWFACARGGVQPAKARYAKRILCASRRKTGLVQRVLHPKSVGTRTPPRPPHSLGEWRTWPL